MISFTQLPQKLPAINGKKFNGKKWIWIGLGLLALLSLRIYYVQEMLAALIIFSVLFVGASIAAVAIFVLVRASKPIIARH